jgi:hypothetical protein
MRLSKLFLKIGKHYCTAASDPINDSPLELKRNSGGRYYWTLRRFGEYHWWFVTRFALPDERRMCAGCVPGACKK